MNIKRKSEFSHPLNIRVSLVQLGEIREAAEFAQVSVSGWMRDRLGGAARREIREATKLQHDRGMSERINNEEVGMKKTNSSEKLIGQVAKEISVGAAGGASGGGAGAKVSAVRMLNGRGGAKLDDSAFGGDPTILRQARKEIGEYLKGKRTEFGLKVDLSGLTSFSRDVLRAAEKIPYGETRSYGWVAKESGHPKASRAVGGALHRNPVPLLIP
ncbi:MAG: methylated-DNA--[protein]-cysteine S-methyltransferase [Nitrospinaceae bacterium]|jgi:hypothetical protein|nr:methylated-DNA--[protein]-cysteine S-methyltransferase [Nitrospinaceae bacterium]MBT4094220.1 methylated-DNA--[protein]-cysteine S-methyltransferase [Nitrospinaceae bacterium]MBT4431096.1 methylated-DNA--[protein]-cysteine S-methyltransferase [Nitrospinaceae bacterium]MBT5366836.1 methylated-DNA--[protein]-cysteine S-methyltransferase [Nitrospinaceae bacterium]MBT5946052.1 methylated-DNA--[protein]-cysteine S-methyltransferase [Nitrospinaceae bacterium]